MGNFYIFSPFGIFILLNEHCLKPEVHVFLNIEQFKKMRDINILGQTIALSTYIFAGDDLFELEKKINIEFQPLT